MCGLCLFVCVCVCVAYAVSGGMCGVHVASAMASAVGCVVWRCDGVWCGVMW